MMIKSGKLKPTTIAERAVKGSMWRSFVATSAVVNPGGISTKRGGQGVSYLLDIP